MSESNNNGNQSSTYNIQESPKTDETSNEKTVKKKEKQTCKKCKKNYILRRNTNHKLHSNQQKVNCISTGIYDDGLNDDPDKNLEIQNLLENKGSFDIKECATKISRCPTYQDKDTNKSIVPKRKKSSLQTDIKAIDVESSRIQLYSMSYCTLTKSEISDNENSPIEQFWKKYNGINSHSNISFKERFVSEDVGKNTENDQDQVMGGRTTNCSFTPVPMEYRSIKKEPSSQRGTIIDSSVNNTSDLPVYEQLKVSHTEKKTDDFKILEVNVKSNSRNHFISSINTLETGKIPSKETIIPMSLKDNTSTSSVSKISKIGDETTIRNSIQKLNIIENSGSVEALSPLKTEKEIPASELKESIKCINEKSGHYESFLKERSEQNSQYETNLGEGNVELIVCDEIEEPRICINPRFVCEGINPNIIFNHSCCSVIRSSCDSISEYINPSVSVRKSDISNENLRDSVQKIYPNSKITKFPVENKRITKQQVNPGVFQVNPYEEYNNNDKSIIINNKTADISLESRSKEELVLNETEFLLRPDRSNLGILASKNDIQNLKKENIKKIYETKSELADMIYSPTNHLSNKFVKLKQTKHERNSINKMKNISSFKVKEGETNFSNHCVNVYEDSYIDVESCATLESVNTKKELVEKGSENFGIKLSKNKLLSTETTTIKCESEVLGNNININLHKNLQTKYQESIPVRFGVNIPDVDTSKPLETKKTQYEKMTESLLTLSEKMEEIEGNIKKVVNSGGNTTTNKTIKESQRDLRVLRERCEKMDKLIDLISNESIVYGSYNLLEKKGRFDRNNIIEKDRPLIENHIKVNQQNKSTVATRKDLIMKKTNEENTNDLKEVNENLTKEYKTFENLVKELTLPLLEENDAENKTYQAEIPSRRIIIQEEDVPSGKEKNILENEEVGLNKEIEELSKRREETIENNLNELNKLIGNKIQTSKKDTLKVPSLILGPKNASRPPKKATRFLLVGPNELIKPITTDGPIRQPKTGMIEKGLKNLELIKQTNIKLGKIADTPNGVIFEKEILIPEIKTSKRQVEKSNKDKSNGAFTKFSKSFTSLFSGDKKPRKEKKVVKSSPKGIKWINHESYLELQRQKGKVKEMIEYYDNLDDKDSDS